MLAPWTTEVSGVRKICCAKIWRQNASAWRSPRLSLFQGSWATGKDWREPLVFRVKWPGSHRISLDGNKVSSTGHWNFNSQWQRNVSEIQTNLTPLELLEYNISVESTLTSFQTPNTTHCTTVDLPAKESASDRSTFMGMTQNDRIPSPIPSECHKNMNTSIPIWENGRNSAEI